MKLSLQLGFVSAILPEFSLEQVFKIAKEMGYDCVEIMCWPIGKAKRRYAGVTHIDADAVVRYGSATINELRDKYSIQISALGYYPNVLSDQDEERKTALHHLNQVIEAAALLEIKTVTTFAGRNKFLTVDDNWPNFIATWMPLIKKAETLNVKIAIENCPMLFTKDEWPGGNNLLTTPAIWERAFTDINSNNFGLNYDPSHFIWQQMDEIAVLRSFGSKLFHLHAKDAKLELEKLNKVGITGFPNSFHQPKLPGRGDVRWDQFFNVLREINFSGSMCVEVEERAYESTQKLRLNALQESHIFLSQLIN